METHFFFSVGQPTYRLSGFFLTDESIFTPQVFLGLPTKASPEGRVSQWQILHRDTWMLQLEKWTIWS